MRNGTSRCWLTLGAEFDVDLVEMGFDFPTVEDFSDRNEEIDLDELD